MKPLALFLPFALSLFGAPALDRVVAVFDKTPILLSEVRARAYPLVASKRDASPTKSLKDDEIADIHDQMLERMIDELVVASEAAKFSITVDDSEIAEGVAQIAKTNNVAPESIYTEAKRLGLSKADYDAEVRRQILEGKWVTLRLRTRMKAPPTDQAALWKELETLRAKELDALRARHYVEIRR